MVASGSGFRRPCPVTRPGKPHPRPPGRGVARAKMAGMTLQPGEARYDVADDSATVVASGEIDVATAPDLRDALYRLVDRGERAVTVDMAAVSFIDSSGLGALVAALKRARQQDGDITVVNLHGAARKVFEITGLLEVFGVDQS